MWGGYSPYTVRALKVAGVFVYPKILSTPKND